MTVQHTPQFSIHSVEAGEAMIQNITAQMQALRAVKKKNHQRHTDWRALMEEEHYAPVAPTQTMDMSSMSLLMMLLQCLFGLPVFGGMGEMLKGVIEVAALNMADENNPNMARIKQINKTLSDTQYHKAMRGNQNQMQQMEMIKQITTLLMMQMQNGHQDDEDESAGGSTGQSHGLAADVLRHPTMARFKQNRQSVSCIRTLFQRQVEQVAPSYSAPRYAM